MLDNFGGGGNRPSCCISMFKFIYIYILQFVILFFITFNIFEAHELRAWLLHYSPVVLYGILPDDYYQHHLLLVESIYLLLQEAIPDKEIDHVVKLLNHYCFMFGVLYGESVLIKYNVVSA